MLSENLIGDYLKSNERTRHHSNTNGTITLLPFRTSQFYQKVSSHFQQSRKAHEIQSAAQAGNSTPPNRDYFMVSFARTTVISPGRDLDSVRSQEGSAKYRHHSRFICLETIAESLARWTQGRWERKFIENMHKRICNCLQKHVYAFIQYTIHTRKCMRARARTQANM